MKLPGNGVSCAGVVASHGVFWVKGFLVVLAGEIVRAVVPVGCVAGSVVPICVGRVVVTVVAVVAAVVAAVVFRVVVVVVVVVVAVVLGATMDELITIESDP
jgi:hypothetical protein